MPLGPHGAASPVDGRATSDVGPAPAIDPAVFDELMAQLGDGDMQIRGEIISSYLTDAEDYLGRLGDAAVSGDTVTAGLCAHTLRSTSALLGALDLAELLQQTEDLAAASRSADLVASAALVESEYQRVRGSLLQRRDIHRSRRA
jgi:HPt (histidine-containing phosphotransfer) domain-containing protein